MSKLFAEKPLNIGSEEYNAPELFDSEEDNNILCYDGIKADIFSSAATLFLVMMQCPPFRSARSQDSYYKRLIKNKLTFWKIFQKIPSCDDFKDLFEKMAFIEPEARASIDQILNHPWL